MQEQIIIVALVVSLLFWEWTNLTPGGLIVMGYLVLALKTPQRVVYTLVLAVVTYGVVWLLSRWLIIYGKRRFVAMVLVSFLIDLGVGLVSPLSVGAIGILIPGIIAGEFDKQGVGYTLVSQLVVGGVLVLVLSLVGYPVFG